MYYVFICKLRLYVILKNILEYGNTWIKTIFEYVLAIVGVCRYLKMECCSVGDKLSPTQLNYAFSNGFQVGYNLYPYSNDGFGW